jgi:hypothetical protein
MIVLLSGIRGSVLVGLVAASALAIRWRRAAMESLDRRFFREQYDTRRILADLVPLCGRATSRADLAQTLTREIDRALHLVSINALFLDVRAYRYVAPSAGVRPIDARSPLASALHDNAITSVDFQHPTRWLAALPDNDRNWLLDAGARLLLSIRDTSAGSWGSLRWEKSVAGCRSAPKTACCSLRCHRRRHSPSRTSICIRLRSRSTRQGRDAATSRHQSARTAAR